MTKGADGDGGFKEFRMEDKMLDPNQAMTRELAEQIAQRISCDVKSHNDTDLGEVVKSVNRRNDEAATARVDQALQQSGFPDVSISTEKNENGPRTEISSREAGDKGTKVERWWDEINSGVEFNGHFENEVTRAPEPKHESGGGSVGGGIHGKVGGRVGG
jgi:hypothetical protein